MNKTVLSFAGILIIGGFVGWFMQQNHNTGESPMSHPAERMSTTTEDFSVPAPVDFVSIRPAVTELPREILSTAEKQGLIFMREEEKLARDVYSVLYETWNLPIFTNIAHSEQTHTEAVRELLIKYNIPDPVTDDRVGKFTNPELQTLFDELTSRGGVSVEEALRVGALIEDLDIADLKKHIAATDNTDIQLLYENLLRGSRNHLRAFVSQLTQRNEVYEPEFISPAEFTEIVSSARETGSSAGRRGWGKQN